MDTVIECKTASAEAQSAELVKDRHKDKRGKNGLATIDRSGG